MLMSLLKELSLVNLPNRLLRKILFVLLLTTSSAAQALTLGDFEVNSFLDRELRAEIVIDGGSGDNLDTVEVSIASEAEFDQAGILRSPLLDQFDFELVKFSNDKLIILVTTKSPVTDPYIHMLLKVRWNGGQLLREFTALIDPPLFASKLADPVDTAKTTTDNRGVEFPNTDGAGSSGSDFIPRAAGTSQYSYGPVAAGDTLSEIAQSIRVNNPDLSIYQIMFALFQENQSAFFDNNINNLQKGATLEISDLNRISEISKQEGVNFFSNQLAQWSPTNGSDIASESASEVNDSSSVSEPSASDAEQAEQSAISQPEATTNDSQAPSSIEENPEFQVAATDVLSNAQKVGDDNQVVTDLKSRLAELEASVESTKLENEELKEIISSLESQLADSSRLIELNNQELANLAAANENNEENNPLVATTSTEETVEEQAPVEEVVTETEQTPATEESTEEVQEAEATPEAEAAEAEESPAPVAEAPQRAPAEFSAPKAQPTLVESIINTIKSFWKFLAVGIIAILAFVYWKVRSNARKEDSIDAFESTFTVYPDNTNDISVDENTSDAKAQELINAIKTADNTKKVEKVVANPNLTAENSSNTSTVSNIDMDALREATQSVNEVDVSQAETDVTKESSFLTVYNDGDVVVNADEIDPIAEADVYIAYGREDQGEEVLLDGVKNFPDRNDIKIALLSLYAKSSKRDKFDEIYESLVKNGLKDNPEELKIVEDLKKNIYENDNAEIDDVATVSSLTFDEDASNTDFHANDNELTELDIESDSFEISEIEFNSDAKDAPVRIEEPEAEVKAESKSDDDDEVIIATEANDNIIEIASEINSAIDLNSALDDEVSINFEDENSELEAEIKNDDDEGLSVDNDAIEGVSETDPTIELNSALDDAISINFDDEESELETGVEDDSQAKSIVAINENENIVEDVSETNLTIDLNSELDDEVSINFDDETDQVDSNTLQADSIAVEVDDDMGFSSQTSSEINVVADDDVNEIDLSLDTVELTEDITSIEQISQIDFEAETMNAEKSLDIGNSEDAVSITEVVDITAEISQVSFDDEVSLTDVMELSMNDVDLTAIPDDQDLTFSKDNSVSELVNDVDFVDEDLLTSEVTVDLTETLELNDSIKLGKIDLDLGNEAIQTESTLPDGNSDPETQLDLAKVFLELDDVPGAIKILKELIGNPLVGEEAQKLLAKNS